MRKFYCIIFPLFKSRCHWPRPLLWLLPQLPAAKHHGCCSGCCCSSRQQNTMALKDEPSPKYTSCGRNVPSEILQRAAGAESYYNQFFTLLLLRLLNSLLPLLLPPPLLWLLLQLPAAKHHGPKGRTESKIYVSRGRNVPSEILQKACCWCGNFTVSFSRFLRAAATGHGRCSGCCRSSRQQNTTAAALAAAAAPGSKTPWP